MLTKILMPNLSFGSCMYCMLTKLLCQNEFWLLCTLTQVQNEVLHMTLYVLGVVCNQVLMSK
jgi:hypothetical protein